MVNNHNGQQWSTITTVNNNKSFELQQDGQTKHTHRWNPQPHKRGYTVRGQDDIVVQRNGGHGGGIAAVVGAGHVRLQRHLYRCPTHLKISKIEKNVSLDPTRPCISTSNKNIKRQVRIHSTFNVKQACIFIV